MQLDEEHLFKLLALPIKKKGYNLLEIKFCNKGPEEIIQLFIYKHQGIEIEDCIKVNNLTKEFLKNEEILDHKALEISSPGIFMKLNKQEHFKIFKGKRIKVKLLQKIQGYKIATGNIVTYSENGISLKMENKSKNLHIPFSNISKANLEPEIKI